MCPLCYSIKKRCNWPICHWLRTELAKTNQECWKHVFVACTSTQRLDSETFKDLLIFEDVNINMKDMFLRYIEREGTPKIVILMHTSNISCPGSFYIPTFPGVLFFLAERIPDLLMFCTGTNQIPPLGFHDPSKMTVTQLDVMSGGLPNSNTCPQELELPCVHSVYKSFKESIDCALMNQRSRFGIV